jgi:hypothetical protein
MDEKDVIKRSFYLFLIVGVIFAIIGVVTQDISYLLGFILGYIINVVVFQLIIKMVDEILKLSMSTVIVIIMYIVKMALYAAGFYIAVKSQWFHLLGVFFGYMITKLSIYCEGYIHKGGK